MKRNKKILIILFIFDIFLLLFYGQVREDARTTFSHKKIIFYWYYFFPIAYFLGGYLLSNLIFFKSKLILNKKLKKAILVFSIISATLYLLVTIALTVHLMYPILPDSIATMFAYCIMTIYTKGIYIFFVLGLLLAVCFASNSNEK